MEKLNTYIESLIFCSSEPVSVAEIRKCLEGVLETPIAEESVRKAVEELRRKYDEDEFSFGIVQAGGGFVFKTKGSYQHIINAHSRQKSKRRLSPSAMETLAIVAYKQPVTKAQLEAIRGVNCDYAVQRLLEKELLEIKGKAETLGRPLLYGTSEKFMAHFGINDLKDLPALKDFESQENKIGEELES
ncbi:MAG: SMC-Scp complex subunit ScpB [Cytophagales bacterium]|nr:SMC-Scp complex subunit ScpB [Cytophagales bacterium]